MKKENSIFSKLLLLFLFSNIIFCTKAINTVSLKIVYIFIGEDDLKSKRKYVSAQAKKKMKRLLFYILFIPFCLKLVAQSNPSAELDPRMSTWVSLDKRKDIDYFLSKGNDLEARIYCQQVLNRKGKGDDIQDFFAHFNYAYYYFKTELLSESQKNIDSCFKYARNYNENSLVGLIHELQAKVYIRQGKLTMAFVHLNKAVQADSVANDLGHLKISYDNLSAYFASINDTKREAEYIYKSKSIIFQGSKNNNKVQVNFASEKEFKAMGLEKSYFFYDNLINIYKIKKDNSFFFPLLKTAIYLTSLEELPLNDNLRLLNESLVWIQQGNYFEYKPLILFRKSAYINSINKDSAFIFYTEAIKLQNTKSQDELSTLIEIEKIKAQITLNKGNALEHINEFVGTRKLGLLESKYPIIYFLKSKYYTNSKQYDSSMFYKDYYYKLLDRNKTEENKRYLQSLEAQFRVKEKIEENNALKAKLASDSTIAIQEIVKKELNIKNLTLNNLEKEQEILVKNIELLKKNKALSENSIQILEQEKELSLVNAQIENTKLAIDSFGQVNSKILSNYSSDIKKKSTIFKTNIIKTKQIATVVCIVIFLSFLIGWLMYKRKMSRLKKLEIEKFQENERKRIAAELHDDLGSKSTSIKMLSELAKNKNQGILKGNELDKIITNANALVDSMGDIIWAMNTNNDSINGLMQYIKLYAEDYLNEHEIGFQFSWDAAQGAIHIQGDKRRNILLVIKEILHNTVKHAHANKVSMDVSIVNNTLQLLVKDDGLGFSESDVKQFSNGILNMQERIKKIGGEIQIKNHQGTQTSLQIPV